MCVIIKTTFNTRQHLPPSKRLYFWQDYFVCLFVGLFVSNITQKGVDRFWWKFQERGWERTDEIFGVIRIAVRVQEFFSVKVLHTMLGGDLRSRSAFQVSYTLWEFSDTYIYPARYRWSVVSRQFFFVHCVLWFNATVVYPCRYGLCVELSKIKHL